MKGLLIMLSIYIGIIDAKIVTIGKNLRANYHPSFLLNKDKRIDDFPILSVETFRANADFILDETNWTIDTEKLFDGCVIFVGLRSLNDFYYKVLPYVTNKIIIVSHGGEPFIGNKYNWDTHILSKGYLTPLIVENPNVLAIFEKNGIFEHPKAYCLPLGKAYWYPEHTPVIKKFADNLTIDSFFCKKKYSVYLNVTIYTHKSRGPISLYWKNKRNVYCANRKPFHEYFSDIKNSKFVLSPRGYGIDCLRTWEVLYAGSIPVVQSEGIDKVYEGLPVIIVKDLTKVTLEDLEIAYEKLKQNKNNLKLERLFADYWFAKIRSFK